MNHNDVSHADQSRCPRTGRLPTRPAESDPARFHCHMAHRRADDELLDWSNEHEPPPLPAVTRLCAGRDGRWRRPWPAAQDGVEPAARRSALGDEAGAHGEGDGVPPVVRAESSEESAGVCLHGVRGHGQFTTDCPVGQAPALQLDSSGSATPAGTVGSSRHGPHSVLAAVSWLGGALPPTLVADCEPAELEDRIGLSTAVAAAPARSGSAVELPTIDAVLGFLSEPSERPAPAGGR